MSGRRLRRVFFACFYGVVILTALLVMWTLDHFAHVDASTDFNIGLIVGLVVAVVFAVAFGMVRKRRSPKVETTLNLVDVPVWRLVLSQLVPTWRARRSLVMLPVVSDLPEYGWKSIQKCTSRVGFLGSQANSPISKRAREMGSILAVRVFELEGQKLWWTFRALPVANEADAMEYVTKGQLVAPVASKATAFMHERQLDDIVVPGVQALWAFEREYRTKTGGGWTRILRGSVGSVVFEIYSSGSPGAADWQEISRMAEVFTQRIRSTQPMVARSS